MKENSFMHDWLYRRHISDSIISEFNVHWGTNPIFGECIVIPVLDFSGDFSFNKYRRNPLIKSDPKYVYDKGSKVTLYAWHKARAHDSVLITEGEMDCLVAWSANIPSVTSTGGALSFQEEWSVLFAEKEVTLLFDNDEAGGKGMAKTLAMIPHAYVAFIPDRPGVKDISDYVASGGDLSELLRTRQRFTCLQDVIDDKARRQSLWQSTHFHDAFIKENTVPEYVRPSSKISDSDNDKMMRAKAYPIDKLVEVNRATGKALCVWHNERTASMHYYKDSNHVYCFGGCGKHGDAIDVYRALYSCSFKQAVDDLNNL